jgi:hypothetical protein
MKNILSRIFIALVFLCIMTWGISPVTVQAAPVSITMSPTTGVTGTSVTITAGNVFTPSETVTIAYDGTTLQTITANTTGGFSVSVAVPSSTAGSHTITATGGSSTSVGTATFTITPSVTVSPATGIVGTSVTVSGTGYGNAETVSVTYDGTVVVSSVAASSSGSWSTSFTLPASGFGARTLTATGTNTATTTFSVTPSITSNKSNAAPGTSVTITGTGFGVSETGITVTYDGVIMTSTAAANSKGGWQATFVVPNSPAGVHSVGAYGSSTSVNNVAAITFTLSAGISVNRPSAAPGTSITVTGSGFNSNETNIAITYDSVQVATVTQADSNGGWKVTFAVPSSPAGSHTIDAYGSNSQASTIADVTFTVTAGIALNKTSATPGSSITVTGTGFGAGESGITISYDGNATPSGIKADASGTWKSTFVVPNSPSGSHEIGASGPTTPATSISAVAFNVIAGISINPPSAAPGTSVTMTGVGFGASETGITITYDDKQVATGITANPQGGWTRNFVIPPSSSGAHSVSAAGSVTPATSLSSSGFAIGAGIILNPSTSNVGGSVVITGSGFSSNTQVKLTYDDTDIAGSVTTDSSGSFSKSITIPKSLAGSHTIKATDGQSNQATTVFSIESTPPPTPSLQSPGDGARVGLFGDATPTLKWSGVTDPSGVVYEVEVDTETDFTHPVIDKTDVSSRYVITSSDKLPRGTYYWRVRAIDGASNQGEWSQTFELTSGVISPALFVFLIILVLALAGGAVYFLVLRRRPQKAWEGVPVTEAPSVPAGPVPGQWRLIEPPAAEGSGERSMPYRLALPQAPKGEKSLSTEETARLKVIIDFAQSLPLVEPGYTSKWLLDLAQSSMGLEPSVATYKQILEGEIQVKYEPGWMRHPIFQDLSALLEGQPILQDLNAFVDAVNRCAAESTTLLQEIFKGATGEISAGFLEKGGWEYISAVYSDAMRWYLGKALRDPSERDYVVKPGEEAGAVYLWGEDSSGFAEALIRALDEKEATQYRTLHLKLRRTYRNSDTVKMLVDGMTQMAVQRDRLSSAFSQFDNFMR